MENNIDIIEEYNNIRQILQGEIIKEVNFPYVIQLIPFKYCIYTKNEDNSFQISPAFDFIYGPLRKVYKEITVPDFINVAKVIKAKNRGELGNIFDSLVNSHFDIGKKIFGFEIGHVIIANEIVNFVYFKKIIHENKDYFVEEVNIEKLFDGKVIYLEQYNSTGQCVDGGFLIPIPNTHSYCLLLYQSSIKKIKHFSKDYIYNYIYKTTKNNIYQTLGIDIRKILFMYIIDPDDQPTVKYCLDSEIYYIFYDLEKSKFLFGNRKEIVGFNDKIYEQMEILESEPKIIELFKNQEESNDLSAFKKLFLNKKRKTKKDEKEGENSEKIDRKEVLKNISIISTDKGYKNEKANIKIGSGKYYEKCTDKTSIIQEKKNKPQILKIPKNWGSIFGNFYSYQIIKKNLQIGNAMYNLPIFYIYENKYLIVKNEGNKDENYSFYSYETGNKLEGPELKEALDSLNIFKNKSEKILCFDACILNKKLDD